jgi:hypothetical protein
VRVADCGAIHTPEQAQKKLELLTQVLVDAKSTVDDVNDFKEEGGEEGEEYDEEDDEQSSFPSAGAKLPWVAHVVLAEPAAPARMCDPQGPTIAPDPAFPVYVVTLAGSVATGSRGSSCV